MTRIDLSKVLFFSRFSGFGTTKPLTLSFNVPATTISFGTRLLFSAPLTNTTNITQQEIQLTGLDPNWYILKGQFETFYDASGNLTNGSGASTYDILIDSGFSGSDFAVKVGLFPGGSAGGPTVVTPAFTLTVNLSLYVTPF